MEQLQVAFGVAARDALCSAFDAAHESIDAEFYSISDPKVIASLNRAAQRPVNVRIHVDGNPRRYDKRTDDISTDASVIESMKRLFVDKVDVIVENHPDVLVHGKAAVVDGATAYISTANPSRSGFFSPGEVLIADSSASDVAAVEASINERASTHAEYVVTGPAGFLRARVDQLLDASADLRVATEDLSDREIVERFVQRQADGHHDRILVEAKGRDGASPSEKGAVRRLRRAGVDVRALATRYMHEKYVDGGDQIYIGSANLTRNGLDEAREVAVVAPAAALGSGAFALRVNFDKNWDRAAPLIA